MQLSATRLGVLALTLALSVAHAGSVAAPASVPAPALVRPPAPAAAASSAVPATSATPAVVQGNPDSGRISDEPLGGIVINRTLTVMGWDFYQYFTSVWRAKYLDSRYTVTVYERPTAQWGSEIWVEYRQKRMFHTFLAPARSATKAVASVAVDLVYKNVVDSNVQSLLFTDVDLGPEEM